MGKSRAFRASPDRSMDNHICLEFYVLQPEQQDFHQGIHLEKGRDNHVCLELQPPDPYRYSALYSYRYSSK